MPYYVMPFIDGPGLDRLLSDPEAPSPAPGRPGRARAVGRRPRPAGGRGAGVCARAGHPPPRHQAGEPAARPAGHALARRLRPGEARRRPRADRHGRAARHAPLPRPRVPRATRPTRGATSTASGLTLYELLVGRPAFGETDRVRLLHQIRVAARRRPERLDPGHPARPGDDHPQGDGARARSRDTRRPPRWPTTCAVPRRPADPGAAGLAAGAGGRWRRRNPVVAGLAA